MIHVPVNQSSLTHYQMTNFRLFQTERVCRRQFQIRQKWQKVIQTCGKHWEKEKLLVTSNFSFSHSVFKRLVSQGRQKVSLCGNGLKASKNLFVWDIMPYQQYSSYLMATVHKSMFPGLFLTST